MKTNANKFKPCIESNVKYKLMARLRHLSHRVARKYLIFTDNTRVPDDYVWETYHELYGPQNEAEEMFYTYDMNEVDFKVISGNIYFISDSKPLHPWNRVVLEAIINLPGISSIHEIGTGGGKLIVNLRRILGESVIFSASDVSEGQLAQFRRRWPEDYLNISPRVHNIVHKPLTIESKADVVFAATVLMHIKEREKYLSALNNLLHSARKYVVILDNWGDHNYVEDIRQILMQGDDDALSVNMYQYNSGAAKALVLVLNGESLPSSYSAVVGTNDLRI
jgi:hypothetical protein